METDFARGGLWYAQISPHITTVRTIGAVLNFVIKVFLFNLHL